MDDKSALARRLFQIETNLLAKGQGHWSLEAYIDEMDNETAEIFLWPSPTQFTAFVLYRVLPFEELWIMNWAVEEKGKKLGLEVFEAFLDFCQEQGFMKIGLEVRSSNAAAIKIYSRCGFGLVGQRQNYYSNGEDALVYMLNMNKTHD